jgi:S-DNA-T family DNA segregation ATPase FtsK/SpoIIIE
MVRAAVAQGDHATALLWEQRAATFRKERHERRMQLLAAPKHLAKAVVIGTGLTFAGLLTLGIVLACSEHRIGEVVGPIEAAIEAVRWCVAVFRIAWLPALLASPVVALASLYATGRRRAELPTWVQSPEQRAQGIDEVITPSILVTALRDLGHGELRKKIKGMADAGAELLGPITSAGCGIEVDVFLPQGVSTAEIQAKRQKLAENLGRHKHELFITIPQRPRTVRLWIADSGALDEPIGRSPLVTDPKIRADYKTGRAPWGQSLRGDLSTVSLFQRHILVAGISNQGKTASLRALILWLALDRRVRLQIADLKGVGDWSMFKGIAEVLIEGPSDQQVMAATHMVEGAVVEMQTRTDLMRELTEKGWSQEKILADHRFAPLVVIVDEAQKAYGTAAVLEGCPYGGVKNTSRYFQGVKALHDQGRAVNVTIGEGVQDPTDQNLPKRSREGNHIRASLVVGTEAQGAMALGENAVNAGAAPHELRQGADKGTVVVAGDITAYDMPRGQVYTTIRTYYVGPEDAASIADRARALRKGVETKDAATEPEKRDVLADVAEVLGTDGRVRTEEVVHRLKSLAPDFYREWTTSELTGALRDTLAAPYKTLGTMHVGLSRVREALEERENASGETETDAPGA